MIKLKQCVGSKCLNEIQNNESLDWLLLFPFAEKALFQRAGRPLLLSLSQVIEADKSSYYAALQSAQCSNEVTDWLRYFVDRLLRALDDAQSANGMGLFTVVHDGTCVFGSLRAAFSKLNIPAVDAK